jgi:outer membrane protein TolC
MNKHPVAMVAGVCGAILAGCASQDERQAFQEFQRLSAGAHSAHAKRAPTEPSQTPELGANAALSDYLAYAALNNPGLEAAFHRWKAALERVPQARALPDPQFTYKYFIVEQAMRDGDMRNMFEISQMLPWSGKLDLRAEVALREAQAERQRFEMEKLKLFNRVKQAYYERCYLWRAVEVTGQNVRQLKSIEESARARYAAAAASQNDLIRAQVELGKLESELRSLEDLRGPTAARLNAALGRSADAELPAPGPIPEQAPAVGDERLSAWLTESNPELKAMDAEIARERKAVELAGKDYLPDVTVGVEIDQMKEAAGNMTDDMRNPVALMFSLNIPIWWEKYAAGVREARARLVAAEREKVEKANSLTVDLKFTAYNYRNAERKIVLYRDTLLPKARQSLKSTQAAYQTAGASFSDLIDAQRILLEFQLSYERALADRRQALAEMEMIVGRDLPASPAGERPPTGPSASRPATQPASAAR